MTLKGYRTVIVNVAAGLPLLLEAAAQVAMLPEFAAILPVSWLPFYGLALALVNLALRRVTTTPMGRAQ